MRRILVTGAGGFIGHHLVSHLKSQGCWVRGTDLKRPEYSPTRADEFLICDLRRPDDARESTRGVDEVYALAADMGGMGYISEHHARIMYNNALIDLNTLEAAVQNGVTRYLYSSSACVYPEYRQNDTAPTPLKESDAYPAQPQDGYGWEKLLSERLCTYYGHDFAIETRIARFHNIFGPLGTWDGGREKVPAALCRKVAMAKCMGLEEFEIWGDGEQTRSFCYVDDCVTALTRLMASNHREPLNIGQDRLISINSLADIVCRAAGVTLSRRHIPGAQGVRGRNSDNTLLRKILGWEPCVSLEEGIAQTYHWIESQVYERMGSRARLTSAAGF